MESPLKAEPACVIAIQKQDQYIPLKFIPIRQLAKKKKKNGPRGVSFLQRYGARAHEAGLLRSAAAGETAGAERSV